jgi:hypothetical protein
MRHRSLWLGTSRRRDMNPKAPVHSREPGLPEKTRLRRMAYPIIRMVIGRRHRNEHRLGKRRKKMFRLRVCVKERRIPRSVLNSRD